MGISTVLRRLAASGIALAVLGIVAAVQAADAKFLHERTAGERPSLLVVGVAHFSNPGLDMVNTKIDDVLAPKRQREIAEIVDRLAAYKPTHVAVEWPIAKQARLDERYRAYRDGKYTLTRDEVDQLGLRLAAQLGLDRVDAADWNEEPPGKESDYDFEAWANAHGEGDRVKGLFDPASAKKEEALLARSTLSGFLCALDAPARRAEDNRVYFDIAMFGDSKDYPGATWVGDWHARNLRIFANLVRIAPRPHDRVVAIFGAGHSYLLTQYATESGAFDVDDIERVLHCR
jgi:Family of unknown function (DUF5694)